MNAQENDWAIRTIGRDRIVEYLLTRHCGHAFHGTGRSEALAEMDRELGNLVAEGLPHARNPGGDMLFDPAEVVDFLTMRGLENSQSLWARHFVPFKRGAVSRLHGVPVGRPDDGLPIELSLEPRVFSIVLERTYNCRSLAADRKPRLRLPLPIEDDTLSGLDMKFAIPPNCETRVEKGRLIAVLPQNPGREVTLAVHARFEARPRRPAKAWIGAEERALYTRPSEGLIRVDEKIAAEAARITACARDDFERARAIFAHICASYLIGAVPYRAIRPARPLEWSQHTGIMDCQLATALFCALCRAVHVPARMIAGYQLYPADMAHHYWAEAWCEQRGWSSFDTLGWALSDGGRDPAWLDAFSGAIDYRIKTEIMPKVFTGASSVALPDAWHMVSARRDGAYETSYLDACTGTLAYRDRFAMSAQRG